MLKSLCRTLVVLWLGVSAAFAAEPLRVAISPDYEPLAFKLDGELAGIEVDNAQAVANFLGRRLVLVEMPMEQFIPSLDIGKVDVVMSGYSITPERVTQVDFAQPFMEVGQMVIVRTEDVVRFAHPSSLKAGGVRIAVEPGTTGEAYALKHYPAALIQRFKTPADAFRALRFNHTDAYIHDAPTSWMLANDKDNDDLFSLYRPLTTEYLAWAVKKGNKILLSQLNAALDELTRNGHLSAIQNSYIPVQVEVH